MPSNYPVRRGCGCVLVVIGTIAILAALYFAFAMWSADEDAGVKNEADWEAYNAKVEQLDTIADVQLRDSLIAEIPHPLHRQGGFATIFGIFGAVVVIVVAAFPLTIGCILMVRYSKRREREEQEKELNL